MLKIHDYINMNNKGCEEILCQVLDDCIEMKNMKTAFEVLKVVQSTFSKFDKYLLLVSEMHINKRNN